jgi:hypothetical protein
VNDEIKWMWKELVWPTLKYYPRLSGHLQKTTKNSNQGSRSLGWEFNMEPPKCVPMTEPLTEHVTQNWWFKTQPLNMEPRTGGSNIFHTEEDN